MESFVINNTEWITSVFWQDIKAKSSKEADKKAEQLTTSKKTPHFVQLVKEVIEE